MKGEVRHEGRIQPTRPSPRSKSAQDGNRMQGEKSKSMQLRGFGQGQQGNEGRGPRRQDRHDGTEGRDGKTGDTHTKGAASTDSKSQTTGNAATSATAAPPAEKRTQIVSAIRSEKIQETTNVNFNISVGAVVPTACASTRFRPGSSKSIRSGAVTRSSW